MDQKENQLENTLKALIHGTRKVKEGYRDIISALESLLLLIEELELKELEELKEVIEEYIHLYKQISKNEKERVILFSASFLLAFSFTSYYSHYKDTRKNEVDEIF